MNVVTVFFPIVERLEIASQMHHCGCIVAKKWDPGILDPCCFRKVEARLGKLAKIGKIETN